MCFTVHSKHQKTYRAKKDIKAYKLVSAQEQKFFSYITNHPYTEGTQPRVNFGYSTYVSPNASMVISVNVEEGYHSYSNKMEAYSHCYSGSTRIRVIEVIIPEGAIYLYNPEDQEYVSTQIVIPNFNKVPVPSWGEILVHRLKRTFRIDC